jgi:hypothetical protein
MGKLSRKERRKEKRKEMKKMKRKSRRKNTVKRMKSSSSSTFSEHVEEIQNYCGDKQLLQTVLTMDQIMNWNPLSYSSACPKNCGPTAVKFIFPHVDPLEVQELSAKVELTGIGLQEFNTFLYNQIQHLDVNAVHINIVFFNILEFFRKNLYPGNVTLVGLSGPKSQHITTVAKDLNNNILLFEGQINRGYINKEIVDYISKSQFYEMFIWCSKHKNKHSRDSTKSSDERPSRRFKSEA